MRRLIATVSAGALLALGCTGCNQREPIRVEPTDESGAVLSSFIHVADPKSSIQLIKGFHAVEQSAWRWTMGAFTATLRPPANAAQKGATLQLKLSVPDVLIAKVGTIQLSAKLNGNPLAPETYPKPGAFVYTRDIPGPALAGEAVLIEFALDKFLPPGTVDGRELGLVVSAIGLQPK